MNSTLRLILLIGLLVLLMFWPAIFFEDELQQYFAKLETTEAIRSLGAWAWLAAIGLIVCDLFLPVPSTTVIAGLGMVYGPIMGGVIGGTGSILAGLIAYWLCRKLGKPAFDAVAGEVNIEKLKSFFARYGLYAIAFSRWMPLLPEILCCLAGVGRMPIGPFMLALTIGSMSMGFAFSGLGSAYADRPLVGMLVSAVIPLLLWPLLYMFTRKREEPANVASEGLVS